MIYKIALKEICEEISTKTTNQLKDSWYDTSIKVYSRVVITKI